MSEKLSLVAIKRMMDLLAVREHSEPELRAKLWLYFLKTRRKNTDFDSASTAGTDVSADPAGAEMALAETEPWAHQALAETEPWAHQALAESEPWIASAIDAAIEHAKLHRWLSEPGELSAKVAADLHRKNKGIEYINHFLETKGLPPVPQESELELEKALALVKNKYSDFSAASSDERMKLQGRLARFLASRGFSSEVVRKVIYEKFRD